MTPSPFEQFGGWDDTPPLYVDDVLRLWWRALSPNAPWDRMPADDAFGMMRPILSELVNESRDPDAAARRARLVRAAAAHGMFRRQQGVRRAELTCDFTIALEAIAGALAHAGLAPVAVRGTVAGLDPDVSLAQDTALVAWHADPTRKRS